MNVLYTIFNYVCTPGHIPSRMHFSTEWHICTPRESTILWPTFGRHMHPTNERMNPYFPTLHLPNLAKRCTVRAVWLARINCASASVHLHLHVHLWSLPILFHREGRALGYFLQGQVDFQSALRYWAQQRTATIMQQIFVLSHMCHCYSIGHCSGTPL